MLKGILTKEEKKLLKKATAGLAKRRDGKIGITEAKERKEINGIVKSLGRLFPGAEIKVSFREDSK